MLGALTVAGLLVLAILSWFFLRTRQQDLLEEIIARKKGSSRVVSRAEYVQGRERIPVALSLSTESIFYQNPDMDASFELKSIDEVEYDDELSTGQTVDTGCGALRLRAHGRAIEFILAAGDCEQWKAALPAHRSA